MSAIAPRTVRRETMAADNFAYPLLFIDKVNSWVQVVPKMVGDYLRGWTFPPPGAIGDVVLIDSSGQLYDVKRVGPIEGLTRPSLWGRGRRPADDGKTSYDYEFVAVGKIAWPDVLNLVCRELDGDYGIGLLDYPDDFDAEVSQVKSEVMSCPDIVALSEVVGVAYVEKSRTDIDEDALVKARMLVLAAGFAALIMFFGWLSDVREWKAGLGFLMCGGFLAQRIAALRSLVRVAPVSNRRIAA